MSSCFRPHMIDHFIRVELYNFMDVPIALVCSRADYKEVLPALATKLKGAKISISRGFDSVIISRGWSFIPQNSVMSN